MVKHPSQAIHQFIEVCKVCRESEGKKFYSFVKVFSTRNKGIVCDEYCEFKWEKRKDLW